MTDAKADIRAAARRLIAAVQHDTVEVTVQRRDVEVLLAAVASGRRLREDPPMPVLHPEQR